MHAKFSKLTQTDKNILQSYIILAEGLADYLGKHYEIIVHSLEDLEHSVIGIFNGFHSGRKVGAPITDLALSMLQDIKKKEGTLYQSYFTKNKRGEDLKSTTIIIQGENQRIIGLLCINMYLDTSFKEIIKNFVPFEQLTPSSLPSAHENLAKSVEELIDDTVEEVQMSVYQDSSIPVNLKTKEITRILYSRGIFNLKNSVERTANILGITKNTIYMHLRHLKKQEENFSNNW
ncbi:helix-turn-helix transcriptional regulator [Garciella nitratireducens]|uniref:helix-turn-helix transcriptional regulator n=1 Tax=Garciella nitratireducens TaxID=218205 RepID=UPI001BD33F54|nr:PAS domain-containing protein [Garciella nitratireducens]